MKETDPYIQLVLRFPLRPLRSRKDLNRAVAVIDALLDREDRSPAEDDYLDVLADLVYRYEQEHYPLAAVSDGEILRFLMTSHDVASSTVGKKTGIAGARLSAVLKGIERLTREEVAALAGYFRVDPGAFAFEAGPASSRPSGALQRTGKRSGRAAPRI